MTSPLHATSRLLTFLDDHANPIVVKEMRQAVASNWLLTGLILFLLVNVSAITLTVLNTDWRNVDVTAGRDVFLVLHFVMFASGALVVPAYMLVRMGTEKSETHVDLYFIAALQPSQIVWGKFLSGMILAALIYCACLPFLTMTYLMRGIDLPSILLILCMDALIITFLQSIAIMSGCLAPTGMVLGFMMILWLGVSTFVIGVRTASEIASRGVPPLNLASRFWPEALQFTLAIIAGVGLFIVTGIASLMPTAANRAWPIRLYLTAAWFVIGLIAIVLRVNSPFSHDNLSVWGVLTLVIVGVTTFVGVGERDILEPRVRREIPQAIWCRFLCFPFFSGTLSALTWVTLISAATFITWTLVNVCSGISTHNLAKILLIPVVILGYIVAYSLTALAIRTLFFRKMFPPQRTIAIALFLLAMGTVGPLVTMWLIHGFDDEFRNLYWYMWTSPLFFSANIVGQSDSETALLRLCVLTGWIVTALLCCVPNFIKQIHSFRPPQPGEFPPPRLEDTIATPANVNLATTTHASNFNQQTNAAPVKLI